MKKPNPERLTMHSIQARLLPLLLLVTVFSHAEPATHPDQLVAPLMPMKVQVSGLGKVFEAPDIAHIDLTFSDRGRDAGPVRDKIDNQVNELLALCRELGIAKSDVQAAQLTIHPEYDYKRDRALIGYRVTRNVKIKLVDLQNYARLLDGAVQIGVTNSSQLQLDFSNRTELEGRAMTAAFQQAREKARLLANEAGAKLGHALWISESGGYTPAPMGVRMMAAESADASYPTGDLEISKSIQVHFELLYDP